MVVVVDGFVSSAGALVAMRMNPEVEDYLFFSHKSSEAGHGPFFQKLGIRPILDLGLRLGEGTGAALAMQIIENALKIYNEMATFEDMGIKPGA
jgi:nicotinate-nucleotide--dimethylbenzimidazole phosphoribosyltransferase